MPTTLKVVLVGCGSMSGAWLQVAQKMPEVDIVGLVDIQEDAARKRAEEYNLSSALISTDLQTALEQTRPQAIFNCTIPEAHFETSMLALHHGCHVLSEKPLAASMEQARQLVDTARLANRIFAVIQNRRYVQSIRRVATFLRTGTIGELTTVNSDFYIGAHFGGFRDHMRHVLLLDMAIHTFDAARMLTGADPVAVYCKEWNPSGSWYEHDASACAIFEMTGGLVYTYRGSWCADGMPTTWEADWRFVGRRGSIIWDGGENVQAQAIAKSGGFTSSYHDLVVPPYISREDTEGHKSLIHEFISCLQTGSKPQTSGADNIKSLAMVFGAIESATSGKRVEIQL